MIAIPNMGRPQNCAECPLSAVSEFKRLKGFKGGLTPNGYFIQRIGKIISKKGE